MPTNESHDPPGRSAPGRTPVVRAANREDLPAIEELVRSEQGPRSLLHRPFVEHYYLDNPFCELHVAIGRNGEIGAVMGTERLRFAQQGSNIDYGCASNWYAFRKGHGLRLYHQGGHNYRYGVVFGGSDDTQAILKRIGWRFFDIPMLYFNRPYTPRAGDNAWRRFVKGLLNQVDRTLPDPSGATTEMHTYNDVLLPRTTPFTFRLAPTVEYLRWRYALNLRFARYRLFRLRHSRGYVILQEYPDHVLVSQCDAEDAGLLAEGVVDALSAVLGGRYAALSCAHPEMLKVFRRYGFRVGEQRVLALGAVAGDQPRNPAGWLINFDWGDNGLRAPFPDWPAANREPAIPDHPQAWARTRSISAA